MKGGVALSIVCRFFDVSPLADEELFRRGIGELVWPERREKIARLRQDKDKRLSLGAGLLAAAMLREAGAEDLALLLNSDGKPYLKARPDIHFNLSHDGTMAVCAVSGAPVGVDIQQLTVYDSGVAERVFLPEEQAWVESSEDRSEAFSRLWARKESVLKLLGTGLTKDMRSFSALPGGESFAVFTEQRLGDHFLCVCSGSGKAAEISEWRYL